MCLHSSATASAAEQSVREEQERRAEVERQVQLLKKEVSGEFSHYSQLLHIIMCTLVLT